MAATLTARVNADNSRPAQTPAYARAILRAHFLNLLPILQAIRTQDRLTDLPGPDKPLTQHSVFAFAGLA
jgi:hypothetical protein